MDTRKLLPLLLGALAVVALAAADGAPALHGAPVLVLALAAALQIGRELANALPARRLHPSAPVMNFVNTIVLLHLAYFAGFQRTGRYSTLIELIATVVVAMFTLVLVAAVMADAKLHGLRAALRDTVLALLLPLVIGGGLGCAFWLPVALRLPSAVAAGELVALVLAAAWAGMGAARAVRPLPPAEGERLRISAAGDAVRLAVSVAVMLAGAVALGLSDALPVAHATLVGVLVAVGTLLGDRLVEAMAQALDVDSFRFSLPRQVSLLQPLYERWYSGGMTDYAGPLVLVFPLVCAYLLWTVS